MNVVSGQNIGGTDEFLFTGSDAADAVATNTQGVARTAARNTLYNGTTYDRQRGNVEIGGVVTASTSSVNGSDQTNYNGRGLHLTIDITAFTGTNIVFTIQGKDPTSGKYYTILASAALTGTGTTVLRVYPGLTAAANTVASDVLPRTFRVITTNTAVSAITATCAASIIV